MLRGLELLPMRSARTAARAGLLAPALVLALTGCKKPSDQQQAAATLREGSTPNVVLVLIDALRADRVGTYCDRGGLTPTLDAIAKEGVVFERAIAPAPWTQPSIASLFCSRYPGVHQVLNYRQVLRSTYHGEEKVAVFDDAFQTLAESLQARGYVTGAFVANPFILAVW